MAPGDEVRVSAFDQRTLARGTLLVLDAVRISVLNRSSELGEIVTHFPRLGYRVSVERG